ncbi:MAG: hypothetical protein ACYSW0_19320 [Planctomycetota bacterium]|jgi:hypothetical protein
MKRRIIITGSILAACHFVLLGVVFSISHSAGMEEFDNPDRVPTTVEKVSGAVLMVLWQPAYSLWTPWMSKHLPNIVEWVLLFANSLLWGFVLAVPPCLIWGNKTKRISDNKAFEATS